MALGFFQGCLCPHCRSIMFAHSWVNITQTGLFFWCPRGCFFARVDDVRNKIPPEKLNKIITSLDPTAGPYISRCWHCHVGVDSRFCKRDPITTLGFICKECNKSLRDLLLEKGDITGYTLMPYFNAREVYFEIPPLS